MLASNASLSKSLNSLLSTQYDLHGVWHCLCQLKLILWFALCTEARGDNARSSNAAMLQRSGKGKIRVFQTSKRNRKRSTGRRNSNKIPAYRPGDSLAMYGNRFYVNVRFRTKIGRKKTEIAVFFLSAVRTPAIFIGTASPWTQKSISGDKNEVRHVQSGQILAVNPEFSRGFPIVRLMNIHQSKGAGGRCEVE